MQRIIFAKVEVWVLLAIAILGLGLTVLFGAMVLDGQAGGRRFGAASQVALTVAGVPETLVQMIRAKDPMAALPMAGLDGRSGWTHDPAIDPGLDGFVLLSRFDGDRQRHVIELRELPGGEVRHSWWPDAEALLGDVGGPGQIEVQPGDIARWRAIHPYPLEDGGLIVKNHYSPLFRLDACAREVWRNASQTFHHSTESDGTGNFWVPGVERPSRIDGVVNSFQDDVIALVDSSGRVLQQRSVAQVLINNGLMPLVFTLGVYVDDPLHLNDIQPVLEDGPYWKAGDLFLSLRKRSMVLLYRPSTDAVVWYRIGPWLSQHDVDILDDHRIAVFNNNIFDKGRGAYSDGVSDVVIYDFATDTTSTPFHAGMERNGVVSREEGLITILPSGLVFAEQETAGRVLIVNAEGDLAAEFVNRAGNGAVYRLGWSRWLDRAWGERVIEAAAAADCTP